MASRASRRPKTRSQKAPEAPTDDQDAQYEAEHMRQIIQGFSNTTLLDESAMFAANDPNRAPPVIPGTRLVSRPAEHIITGISWSDMAPEDYANLAEMEFPLNNISPADLPALSTSQIASRKFSAGVLTSERATLADIDDWLLRCRNAPDGEHIAVLNATATSFVSKYIGEYQPPDSESARVLIYYCWVDMFVFIALTTEKNISAWQFYLLGERDK